MIVRKLKREKKKKGKKSRRKKIAVGTASEAASSKRPIFARLFTVYSSFRFPDPSNGSSTPPGYKGPEPGAGVVKGQLI